MSTSEQRDAAQRNGLFGQTALNELGEKIFLDRYALKDMTKRSLAVDDTVIVCVNQKTRQREIGRVLGINRGRVTVELRDGSVTEQGIEDVDKPLETDPGQMMDRVARGIAAVETDPLKREQWEHEFRWLLDNWKFVPGGRILTAAGTEQQLTFYNCMPPEQEILTADGYRPIGEVAVGDLIVTHRKRLRRVLSKFERETDELLYMIRPKKLGFDELRVTGEHKVLAVRSEWVNIKHRSRDGLRLKQEPQWIAAKDLRPGDFLAAAYNAEEPAVEPIYVSEFIAGYERRDGGLYKAQQRADYHGYLTAGGTHGDVSDRLVVDSDLCLLFGRWLGDGCVNHRTKTDIPSGIKIVFALDEREEAERYASIIEAKFGVKTSLKLSSTERWYDLWANSMALGEFFKAFFGCYSYGKRIPAQLMQLPKDLTYALLKGLFTADGYISGNKLGIVLSNRALATQTHQLLQRQGFLFSIYENTHQLGRHPAYRVDASANECASLFQDFFGVQAPAFATDLKYYFEHDGLRWLRIGEIAIEDYSGVVLDIEVDEDHSFISAGVVVSNCYVVPSPRDSRKGIVETLSQMMEIMSRGGGVGINLSSLRPQHAYVKGVNGRSSGSVSWGGLYSFVTGLIEQGGSRRGALMLILNVWHPDVFNFINSKREAGKITNANISVGLTDAFMEAVETDADWDLVFPDPQAPGYEEDWDGDLDAWRNAGRPVNVFKTVRARELWNQLIESAWASAEPGLWFIDRSNKMSNSHYFSRLISTNPCITGDTRIYTGDGLVRARELYHSGQPVEAVIDGRFGRAATTSSASGVFRTGTKPVFRLQTREGYYVRATADHRIMTERGWVELQHLEPGDTLHILNRKGGFGGAGSLELGRTLGWLVGDGTLKQDRAVLSFFGAEKRELAPLFAGHVNALVEGTTPARREYPVGVVEIAGRDEARVQSERLLKVAARYGLTERKHRVPEAVFWGTEDMQRGFLQALFTADGGVQYTTSNGSTIRLASSVVGLLEEVQQLLLNFGIASRLYRNRRPEQHRMMPDGKGGLKSYLCKAQHELAISKQNIERFADEIGFMVTYKNERLRDVTTGRTRGTYAEHFVATVQSITPDGVEDVFDLTEPFTHSFIGNGITLHNCGEQPLPAFGICNLGAINLGKFVNDKAVEWDELRRAVRAGVRFLDNVIDSTPYFFEENLKQQQRERRVGLGIMGLAEMLVRLEIRYGSDECLKFLDQLGEAIATEAYYASADYAEEKGAFPEFDAAQLLESGYMQAMPEPVRAAVREKGLRNVTLLTVAPTGCVAPDTLVSTTTGLRPIVELGDPQGDQWQVIDQQVHTDAGVRSATRFFVNGRRAVRAMSTKRGFNLTATPNHRIRIIDQSGDYVWRRMDELQVGDRVVLKRNTLGEGETVPLLPVEHGVNSRSHSPQTMTPALAELLGLYMGDGYLKVKGGLHIVACQDDPDLRDHIIALMRSVWGERDIAVEQRVGCWTINLNGRYIPRQFEANGLAKPKGNAGEGAAGAFIPSKLLQAGRTCVAAFLRGLFEADGSVHRGTITLMSVSQRLIQQAQVALLGLGIVATARQMPPSPDKFGERPLYELRMLNRREAQRFVEVVGFASRRKRNKAAVLGTVSDRGDHVDVLALCDDFYSSSRGLPNDVRQTIIQRVSNGALTQQFVKQMVAEQPALEDARLAKLVAMDVFLDEVASVEEGVCETYDLSVPSNETYIANGFVSHNTTGTMVNTSTGVEPYFSWSFFRKSRLGVHEEKVAVVEEWQQANPGQPLPDFFVNAMELTPIEHVNVQGALQRWVDSAISKTCNVPNDYTVDQTRELYERMYRLGCKGGTIYRDGSRDEQVLNLKKDEPKAEAAPAAAAAAAGETPRKAQAELWNQPKIRPRPKRTRGTTIKQRSPLGAIYVTINDDDNGEPLEVFITTGKAGSDVTSMADGMGRLMSILLRVASPVTPSERLREVIDQLKGIGGSRSTGFGKDRVRSLPDAVAMALEECISPTAESMAEEAGVEQAALPFAAPSLKPDLCPECGEASFVHEEGCMHCNSCGFSQC